MRRISESIKSRRIFVLVAICAVVIGSYVIVNSIAKQVAIHRITRPTNDKDNADYLKQQEMMRIILDVGSLAPIPSGARVKVLKTEGNMFTRSFRLVFEADKKEIEQWIHASKGMQSATVTRSGYIDKYVLKPKDASYAEVLVDDRGSTISVYVSFS